MSEDPNLAAEYEALLQFVYMAPVGIVQIDAAGTVAMMNPMAAQLLVPLVPGGDLEDFYGALEGLLPQAREQAAAFTAPSGPVFQDLRVSLPPVTAADGDLRVLSFSLIRLDTTRLVALVNDVSEVAKRERQIREKEAWHNASLKLALDAAQEANRAKSEFLANISHELRTPMHSITSFARLGHDRSAEAPREKLQRYFGNIDGSAKRLNTLLNDLLDLAEIEAGKMSFALERHDLCHLLRTVAADFEAKARDRGVTVEHASKTAVALADVDDARIRQVFANLLSNAIKFGPPGGTVSIEVANLTRGDGEAVVAIDVSDQGPGIPPDELEAVFDKFVQSSKTKTGAGGTGLGLAIAREILAAHRGRIEARNRNEGGAVFHVELPASSAAGATAATFPASAAA